MLLVPKNNRTPVGGISKVKCGPATSILQKEIEEKHSYLTYFPVVKHLLVFPVGYT